jgi:hypothetical protein
VRYLLLVALVAGPVTALAQAPPLRPRVETPPPTAAERQKADAAAVLDCEQMWDQGTHMTRQDWSRTCRRVQGRLQNLPK